MFVRGVVFDLDGTLLDTLEDIALAMNEVLSAAGLPTHPLDAYRRLVGWGARDLIRRAAPDGDQDALLADFRARYYGRGLHGATRPYEGVPQLLHALVARRVPVAVLSNKPHEPTVAVIGHYFPDVPFVAVLGARPSAPIKPDPTVALTIAEGLGLSPSECAFVGDTEVDIETGRRAGMRPIGVSWGFRAESLAPAGAERVLDAPEDLLSLLGS
ncbi:MAG: HAD-IA family hydrolase [Myxococcales bacterium]|nr:HAD-IA family hydrolase [Myxococcales bacterium]